MTLTTPTSNNNLETRSTSALFKRAEQLKRWHESDTAKESPEPKVRKARNTARANSNNAAAGNNRSNRVQFTDGCVFLAACAAADKEEVQRLVAKGADIDTANVDGLTALHQACIDDNLEMVEFLVQRGADVNRGDNEGWTPLHATASCGFLSIAKFLLDHGANVSSVNNDGELAIDISESDEMEELLQKEIEQRGVDPEESRNREERIMIEDARKWLNAKQFGDVCHPKTGASALHVAAAKGYVRVMALLVQGDAPVNCQDLDGWTPMHAAAHWGQREACQILADHYANLEVRNYVGQTCFDVADPDVLGLLEDLRRKQATMQKNKPEIRSLINQPPLQPSQVGATGKRSNSFSSNLIMGNNNNNSGNKNGPLQVVVNDINEDNNDRSSITRLSLDDKAQRSKEVNSQEKATIDTIPEAAVVVSSSPLVKAKQEQLHQQSFGGADLASEEEQEEEEGTPGGDPDSDLSESEMIHARTKAGLEATKRNRANLDLNVPRILTPASSTTAGLKSPSLDKKAASGATPDSEEVAHPWRRPQSLRSRPTSSPSSSPSTSSSANRLTIRGKDEESGSGDNIQQLRRVQSFESDDKFYARLTELRNRIKSGSQLQHQHSSMPILHDDDKDQEQQQQQQSTTTTTKSALTKTTSLAPSTYSSLPRSLRGSTAKDQQQQQHLPSLPESAPLTRSISLRDDDSSCDINKRTSPLITDLMTTTTTATAATATNLPAKPPTNLDIWKRRDDISSIGGGAGIRSTSVKTPDSPKVGPPPVQVRSNEKGNGDDVQNNGNNNSSSNNNNNNDKAGISNVFKTFFKSFVPPVRDEESETQRKAHAKRVRETRRSTQGVTLEDLKSAEQLVKKKQQQENQLRTSELQQLATSVGSNNTGTTSASGASTSATLVPASTTSTSSNNSPAKQDEAKERRPSWRLKVDSSDKNRFRLEETTPAEEALAALKSKAKKQHQQIPSISLPSDDKDGGSNRSSPLGSPKPGTQQAIQRRKKPKRRSTGVVQLDMDDMEKDSDEDSEADETARSTNKQASVTIAELEREARSASLEAVDQSTASDGLIVLRKDDLNSLLTAKPTLLIGRELSLSSEGVRSGAAVSASAVENVSNSNSSSAKQMTSKTQTSSDVDYKKLWEESQKENSRLRDDLGRMKDDLGTTKRKLDTALHSSSSGLSETEKREKKALEKKLSEMEEELKQLEHLKNDNQRLRDENGALIRVISKLSK